MGHPLTIAYKGDEFARVNYDGSWSVDWPKTINYRFETMTPRNAAVVAFAVALVGARDNFWLTPWSLSEEWKDEWKHESKTLDVEETEPEIGSVRSRYGLKTAGISAARVNYDGSWSVNWSSVAELARESLTNYKILTMVAFCQMMMAAQYRFQTTAWDIPPEEDE